MTSTFFLFCLVLQLTAGVYACNNYYRSNTRIRLLVRGENENETLCLGVEKTGELVYKNSSDHAFCSFRVCRGTVGEAFLLKRHNFHLGLDSNGSLQACPNTSSLADCQIAAKYFWNNENLTFKEEHPLVSYHRNISIEYWLPGSKDLSSFNITKYKNTLDEFKAEKNRKVTSDDSCTILKAVQDRAALQATLQAEEQAANFPARFRWQIFSI